MKRHLTPSVLLGLVCGGCTTTIDLSHSSTEAPEGKGNPAISTVLVEDARMEQDGTTVAIVADLYGNPRAELVTRRPLVDEVRDHLLEALRQRNLLAAPGADMLLVRIVRLQGVQREQPEAVVALTDRLVGPDGHEYFVGTSDVTLAGAKSSGDETVLGRIGRYAYPGLLGPPGPFPSTDSVGAVTAAALSKAVDQALDNPDFRAALEGRRSHPP